MKKTRTITVLLALACATGPASASDSFLGRPRTEPAYQSNFYNYPHALGPDYVFRTERVFSPQNLSVSWWDRLSDRLTGLVSSLTEPDTPPPPAPGERIGLKVRQMAQSLATKARPELDDNQAIAVSSFVTLGNLYRTSSFGRHLSERLLNELAQAGLDVVEVRKTPGLMLSKNHGEYGLSRDVDEIGLVHPVQALVIGTYTVAGQEIFVSARIVRNQDNRVLASADLTLPLDSLTGTLLADESLPATTRTTMVGIRAFPEEKPKAPSAAPTVATTKKGTKK